MRGDATFCHEVDFGPDSVWGVQRYFEEQLAYFDRWLLMPTRPRPQHLVMGGRSCRKTPQGKVDHGGRWREEWERPWARRVDAVPPPRGRLTRDCFGRRGEAPAVRRPSTRPTRRRPAGLYCSIGESRGGQGPARGVGALPQPRAAAARPAPGPARPEGVAGVLRLRILRLSQRPDVLVFQTEPLTEPVEVTGRMRVHLGISGSAIDTDFTAKVVDVASGQRGLPGFDMILNHPLPLQGGLLLR